MSSRRFRLLGIIHACNCSVGQLTIREKTLHDSFVLVRDGEQVDQCKIYHED